MQTFYLPVGGTRAWNDRDAPKRRWWQADSDFASVMAQCDCFMVDPEQPFVWTTNLNGHHFWRRWPIWFGKIARFRDHRDWVSGGENFIRYCETPSLTIVPYEHRNVITHSHGFNPVIYACKFGLKIRRLISIAPPFRKDMEENVMKALPNIEKWFLIIDPNDDRIARWGQLGDGVIRVRRDYTTDSLKPHKIIKIPNHGHSGLVSNQLSLWRSASFCDLLK